MKDDAPDTIREAAYKAMGGIDVLVNSAGGSRPTEWDAPEDQWAEGMTLNFTAIRRLTTGIVPDMQKNKYGRIINITGSVEPKGVNIANAAKSAVHAWAKGLSRIIGPDGITVNSISPGRIKTEQILKRHATPENREEFSKNNIPVGYFGEPEDLVCLIVFLASPVARYITGELFHVDGGMKFFAH
jgi:3-oxoacyl-[acyl-carrier protein] reductase